MYDCIVVGAGISGLVAAYRVKQRRPQSRVLVLEAKERIGGRTYTIEMQGSKKKCHWDLGGQWISKDHVHVKKLCKERGVALAKTGSDKKLNLNNILHLIGQQPIKYAGSIIDVLKTHKLGDVHKAITKMDELSKTIDEDDPISSPNGKIFDKETLTHILEGIDEPAKEFVRVFERNGTGNDCQESLLYTMSYSKLYPGGYIYYFKDEEMFGDLSVFKEGSSSLYDDLASYIGMETILVGQPVTEVSHTEGGVCIKTANGGTYESKYAIFALPVNCLQRIDVQPAPYDKYKLARFTDVGCYIKCIATYNEAFWHDQGYSGVVMSSSRYPGNEADLPPFSYVADYTVDDNPALVVFITARHAAEWAKEPHESIKRAVLDGLVLYFGVKARTSLRDYIHQDWNDVAYNGGCPNNYVIPGGMQHYTNGATCEPFGRLHWAGTEASEGHTGDFIDGAVEAGERSANEILALLC